MKNRTASSWNHQTKNHTVDLFLPTSPLSYLFLTLEHYELWVIPSNKICSIADRWRVCIQGLNSPQGGHQTLCDFTVGQSWVLTDLLISLDIGTVLCFCLHTDLQMVLLTKVVLFLNLLWMHHSFISVTFWSATSCCTASYPYKKQTLICLEMQTSVKLSFFRWIGSFNKCDLGCQLFNVSSW